MQHGHKACLMFVPVGVCGHIQVICLTPDHAVKWCERSQQPWPCQPVDGNSRALYPDIHTARTDHLRWWFRRSGSKHCCKSIGAAKTKQLSASAPLANPNSKLGGWSTDFRFQISIFNPAIAAHLTLSSR